MEPTYQVAQHNAAEAEVWQELRWLEAVTAEAFPVSNAAWYSCWTCRRLDENECVVNEVLAAWPNPGGAYLSEQEAEKVVRAGLEACQFTWSGVEIQGAREWVKQQSSQKTTSTHDPDMRVSDTPEFKQKTALLLQRANLRLQEAGLAAGPEKEVLKQQIAITDASLAALRAILQPMLADQAARDAERRRLRRKQERWTLLTLQHESGGRCLRATNMTPTAYMLWLYSTHPDWLVIFSHIMKEHEFEDIPEELKEPPGLS